MTLQTLETVIRHWVTLIKAHEKLLLAIIVAFTLIHFGDKAYDAYGNHLKAVTTADNAQIASIEKQNADTQAKLDSLKATVDANSKLDDAKIAKAKQTIIVKEKEVAALPLPELSKEWQSLIAQPEGSITPQTNGTITVTTDAAHTTVSELEKVGPLTEELAATEDKFNGCVDVRKQQDVQIAGLNTDITAEKKARVDDAKQAKHDIHHAYFKGLKHGIIIGVAGTLIAVFH